jgi:hypothetical protein
MSGPGPALEPARKLAARYGIGNLVVLSCGGISGQDGEGETARRVRRATLAQ